MSDVSNENFKMSSGGRPTTDESEEHFARALILYLHGLRSGSEIGRRLHISPQAGCNLLKKVREHLNEQLLAKEKTAADFEFQRVQAIEMANDLLCEAWNIFSLGSLSVRIQALNIILSVQKYIAELSGAMVGVATRNIIAQKYGEDWVKELVSRNKYAGMSTAELQSRLDYLHQEIEKQEQEKLKK